MRYHMIQLNEDGGTADDLELRNDEFRRILTHLVSMERIREKPELVDPYANPPGKFRLVEGEGALLARFERRPPPETVRHLLREREDDGDSEDNGDSETDGGGGNELHLSPMEYRLLKQMILSTRELAAKKKGEAS